MSMVQNKSSRGQWYIKFTDIELVVRGTACFNVNLSVQSRDHSFKFSPHHPAGVFKGNVRAWILPAWKSVKLKPHYRITWTFLYQFQNYQLVWSGVTCHSKRHSVPCASQSLIIYGFIVCVVCVADYCWARFFSTSSQIKLIKFFLSQFRFQG